MVVSVAWHLGKVVVFVRGETTLTPHNG